MLYSFSSQVRYFDGYMSMHDNICYNSPPDFEGSSRYELDPNLLKMVVAGRVCGASDIRNTPVITKNLLKFMLEVAGIYDCVMQDGEESPRERSRKLFAL